MYIMLSDFTHYASVGIHGSRAAPPIKVARKPTWTNSVKNDEKWARKKGEIVRKWKFMLIDFLLGFSKALPPVGKVEILYKMVTSLHSVSVESSSEARLLEAKRHDPAGPRPPPGPGPALQPGRGRAPHPPAPRQGSQAYWWQVPDHRRSGGVEWRPHRLQEAAFKSRYLRQEVCR